MGTTRATRDNDRHEVATANQCVVTGSYGLSRPLPFPSLWTPNAPAVQTARRDDPRIQGVPKSAAYPPQNAAPRMPATSHQIGSPTPIVCANPTMKPSTADSKVPRTLRVSVPVLVEPKSIRHRIALPARNEGGSPCRLLPFDKRYHARMRPDDAMDEVRGVLNRLVRVAPRN